MKITLPLLTVVLLCGCASEPAVVPPGIAALGENACLPEAVVMVETLRKQGTNARILIVNTPGFSHALVVFLFPVDKPAVWVWDADTRSVQVTADFNQPEQVAHAWLDATLRDDTALRASYL